MGIEMGSQILIIDDEKNYLLILEALLEEEGYTVTALSDPAMALAYLDESEVDVVIRYEDARHERTGCLCIDLQLLKFFQLTNLYPVSLYFYAFSFFLQS